MNKKIIVGGSATAGAGLIFTTLFLLGVFNTPCVGDDCFFVEINCNSPQEMSIQNFIRTDVFHDNRSIYDENITSNRTIFYDEHIDVYNVTTSFYCPKESVDKIKITYKGESKKISFEPDKYTYSFKNGTLTMKDLSRGGSWNDRDLDSCYNPGVPCQSYDFSEPGKVVLKKGFKDKDKKVKIDVDKEVENIE